MKNLGIGNDSTLRCARHRNSELTDILFSLEVDRHSLFLLLVFALPLFIQQHYIYFDKSQINSMSSR